MTLSTTKPTRTGYTFQGWAETSTATTAEYSVGGTYTKNESKTLYAVWKANTYTITYNANGGSGAPGSQTKTYGVNLTLSTTKPTRTGYTFQGWAETSTATSATYTAGGTYSKNQSKTLYAVWKKTAAKPSEIFDSAGTNPNGLHIGDFVNYDAGTWTQDEIKAIQTGLKTNLVTANGSTDVPRKAFQFGGFTAGSSRNGNATPNRSYSYYNYVKDKSTNQAITGWRVFDIDGNKVTLISAGNPEDYYHQKTIEKYGYISQYILTGSASNIDPQNYQKRDWSNYINRSQKAESAGVLTKYKLDAWYEKYTNTLNANTYTTSTFRKIYTDSTYYRYLNMIDNYSVYWLCTTIYGGAYFCGLWTGLPGSVSNSGDWGFGLRILVTLSSNVQFTAEKVGTKTVTEGNLWKYGGDQRYNVWDIITK